MTAVIDQPQQSMNVWAQYRADGRHLKMLMSTTKCLSMMKAWVIETGLIPDADELNEGLVADKWGILTPSRNRIEAKDIVVQDDDDEEEETIHVEKSDDTTVSIEL